MHDTTNDSAQTELPSGVGRCAVTCPMCGCKHSQYRLNPRMYWNTGLDIDRKPTDYQCLKGLAGLHPPLYELWQCPECHFTAHNRNFPEPLKGVFIEKGMVPRKLAEARASDTPFARVCQHLAVTPAFHDISFVTAILTALMELHFAHFLLDMIRQGYGSIARGYLRLAWLYRDWKVLDPDSYKASLDALNARLQAAKTDWPDMPLNERDALEKASQYYEKAVNETAVENDPREQAGILQHMARIRLQLEDFTAARENLDMARRQAIEAQNHLNTTLKEDNQNHTLTSDERSQKISDVRRLQVIIDDCSDLMASTKNKIPSAASGAQKSTTSGTKRGKKGLLKGLFGG